MIAALFVQKGGAYFDLPGVDPWDEARDARLYDGPHAVVAHPPCARWCRLAGLVEKRYPHLRKGEDGGCFASALSSVFRFGGVLEHPAYSDAWPAHGLLRPPAAGGWSEQAGIRQGGVFLPAPKGWGAYTCHVEQGNYGHPARKATWLYAVVPDSVTLPELRWGKAEASAWVGWTGNHNRSRASGRPSATSSGALVDRPRLDKKAAASTPPDFRAVLLDIARQVELCR